MRALACAALLAISSTAAARPDTPTGSDLWKYGVNDVVEKYPASGGNFCIHFTRAGVNAVPLDDANNNMIPDFVEEVHDLYESVLAFYHQTLGFDPPLSDANQPGNNGGDGRFDVYLLDFGLGGSDGSFVRETCTGDTCTGFMVQENDFAGFGYPSAMIGNRILASHEFFHAVQAGYDANQTSILLEGTAVWATEKFDDTLDDFEGFVPGYLAHTDRSLDKPLPGPVDPFSYGSALWWEFLDEHVGGNIIREIWEDCRDGANGVTDPLWWDVLDPRFAKHSSSFEKEFSTFAVWNLYTGPRADSKRAWARGGGYPIATMTKGTAFYRDDLLRVFYASTQYLALQPAGRTQVTAFVSSTQDLAPLTLELAVRTGNQVSDPVAIPLGATGPLPTVDATGADEVLVLVNNGAQSGDSLKGTLCVGSPSEVEACRPAPPDMGGGPDAGGGGMNDQGGCSIAARRPSHGGLALLLAAAALLLRSRSRSCSRSRSRSRSRR